MYYNVSMENFVNKVRIDKNFFKKFVKIKKSISLGSLQVSSSIC